MISFKHSKITEAFLLTDHTVVFPNTISPFQIVEVTKQRIAGDEKVTSSYSFFLIETF